MKTNTYDGKNLRLTYPSFLKVKSVEPQWAAIGPKQASSVCVQIDADQAIVEAYSEMLQSSNYRGGLGLQAEIVREGKFKTSHGLNGFERVVKLVNGIGQVFWGWGAVCLTPNEHSVVIDIRVPDENWQNGKVWQDLIDSMEIK